MADVQSATAEIRRGKKKTEEETTGQKYNGLLYSIGDHKEEKKKKRAGSKAEIEQEGREVGKEWERVKRHWRKGS